MYLQCYYEFISGKNIVYRVIFALHFFLLNLQTVLPHFEFVYIDTIMIDKRKKFCPCSLELAHLQRTGKGQK